MHYSRLYNYTPMPYSLFFHGGYAIHGTTEIRNLGRAVSHGCIRLSPDNAKSLFELVQIHGLQNTTIEISE
jgi:lipoprotein-anchoring transpeptidase ErfK/SrfK